MGPDRITKQTGLASLACTACRAQHLKCDGKKPTCSRCLRNESPCHYQPSRRGGSRRSRVSTIRDEQMRQVNTITVNHSPVTQRDSSSAAASASSAATNPESTDVPDTFGWTPSLTPSLTTTTNNTNTLDDSPVSSDKVSRNFRLYYENFHPAHPILVPSALYNKQAYPAFLSLVVDFIGSHYAPYGPNPQQKVDIFDQLYSNTRLTYFKAQASLIFSIILFARGDLDEAHDAFWHASEAALASGMYKADFATRHFDETSIEAESLRRTWWELFITDIQLAVPQKTVAFRCSKVVSEVPLPCEEHLYNGAHKLPTPRKMRDFKRRILSDEEIDFSSFSYRIEAATILGRVLVLNRLKDCHRDHSQAIENALISWSNHLPSQKLEMVNSYGAIDEMMFQAQATIAHASMILHLPRSNFQSVVSIPEDSFWPHVESHCSLSASTRLIQSIKATEASKRLSDYISLCLNIQKHTPFIIPALVLCGMIQLATSLSHADDCFEHHYNRITLILGCLKKMKQTWKLADSAYQQVRSKAAALLNDRMDKWNGDPLPRSIAPSQEMATERGQSAVGNLTAGPSEKQDSGLDFESIFIDPLCYNTTLFNMPDMEFN